MRRAWVLIAWLAAVPAGATSATPPAEAHAAERPGAAALTAHLDPRRLRLRSAAALVVDQRTGAVLYAKNAERRVPIASITKLMTAVVVLDAGLALDAPIRIRRQDVDRLRRSRSRLRVGTVLPRGELLRLALMASENRAAAALARTYPGGKRAFVRAMNRKAAALGMHKTRFVDPTGLASRNVSTAADLAVLTDAAYDYALIRRYSTTPSHVLWAPGWRRKVKFVNTNLLVRRANWRIGLSKTGYLRDAGRCLVMRAVIAGRPVIIVLLNSWGRYSPVGDANRIRRWLVRGLAGHGSA